MLVPSVVLVHAVTASAAGRSLLRQYRPVPIMSATSFLNVALPALPGGGRLEVIEGLEDAGEDEDEEALADLLSVGGTVWPSAAALCRWMCDHATCVRGANVLELGCGTGVCGLFAAALGAKHTVLTDGSRRLLALSMANREANMLRGNLPGLGTSVTVDTAHYLWNHSPLPTVSDGGGSGGGSGGGAAAARRGTWSSRAT